MSQLLITGQSYRNFIEAVHSPYTGISYRNSLQDRNRKYDPFIYLVQNEMLKYVELVFKDPEVRKYKAKYLWLTGQNTDNQFSYQADGQC